MTMAMLGLACQLRPMTHPSRINVILLLLFSILHLSMNASANCTANCVEVRREWPQFDFDFYYEHSGDGPNSPEPSLVSYSVHTTAASSTLSSSQSIYLSPSLSVPHSPLVTSSPSISAITSSLAISTTASSRSSSLVTPQSVTIQPSRPLPSASSSNASHCPCEGDHRSNSTSATATQTSTSKNWLESYLLRSVFRNEQNGTEMPARNLSVHFQDTIKSIYEYALNKQKQQLSHRVRRHLTATENNSINVTIWDLQVDNSSQTIDVIYYLEKDGVLTPYEDAMKMMSFASSDYIYNQTGYEVIHKVRRYNDDSNTPRSATFEWFNLSSLMALLIMLVLSILLIALLYLKYRREKRRWLESINREINRVRPSPSRSGEKDSSHWNYGQDEEEEEDDDDEDEGAGAYATEQTSPSGTDKRDKSSQYDYEYSTDYRQPSFPDPNVIGLPDSYPRERLIPIGTSSISDSDYDRISYIRTQETLKETKRQPNILEIQLSKETQSIVQEIRKELNRFNFKKIIDQETADQTTSEA